MGKPIDANGTQARLDWSQINWRKVEKTVLRLPHRIFMAKVDGDNLCLVPQGAPAHLYARHRNVRDKASLNEASFSGL